MYSTLMDSDTTGEMDGGRRQVLYCVISEPRSNYNDWPQLGLRTFLLSSFGRLDSIQIWAAAGGWLAAEFFNIDIDTLVNTEYSEKVSTGVFTL